jgi:hypothetical protein
MIVVAGPRSDQWCNSMIRMISGIGIPSSHSRIGMVLSFGLVASG